MITGTEVQKGPYIGNSENVHNNWVFEMETVKGRNFINDDTGKRDVGVRGFYIHHSLLRETSYNRILLGLEEKGIIMINQNVCYERYRTFSRSDVLARGFNYQLKLDGMEVPGYWMHPFEVPGYDDVKWELVYPQSINAPLPVEGFNVYPFLFSPVIAEKEGSKIWVQLGENDNTWTENTEGMFSIWEQKKWKVSSEWEYNLDPGHEFSKKDYSLREALEVAQKMI